jgi:subtilisin family serine protease
MTLSQSGASHGAEALRRAAVAAFVLLCLAGSGDSEAAGRGRPVPGSIKRASRATYIVQLEAPPLASYRGGIAGLAATSAGHRGERRLDAGSAESRRYAAHLVATHQQVLATAARTLGRAVSARHHYTSALNGMALELTPAEAAALERLPGVRRVEPNRKLRILSDAGPAWIGAPGVWNGTATGGLPGTQGEGIVIGVIDTGINMDHPSFADIGGDGYDHTNPRGAGNFVGWCDPANPDFDPALVCNDKLIGVWSYPESGGDPEDDDGHGSHTASIAAGNHTVFDFAAQTIQASGVAPHAHIIAYDVCLDLANCPTAVILAAMDQAVADGVDVVSMAIGGPALDDPWNDVFGTATLGVRDAGIFVASAAGSSMSFWAIFTPASAPWVTAVGATTHSREFSGAIASMSGGAAAPPPDLPGRSLTGGYGPVSIVRAESFGDAWCSVPFAADTFSGQIVVCRHSFGPAVAKGENVLAAGAGGLVLTQYLSSTETLTEAHVLPAVHLGFNEGNQLLTWLNSGGGHTGSILAGAATSNPSRADILASFSPRGPGVTIPHVVKPDLVAPGVDILAATKDPDDSVLMNGTSMASSHVAGAAALLSALHPEWTPGEVQSALMTTAATAAVKLQDGVSPANSALDRGSGRIDVAAAARAGLVLDVGAGAFAAASPDIGGDPATLNLPTLAHFNCVLTCSWTRIVRSTLDIASQWTVSVAAPGGVSVTVTPSAFALAAGATQSLQITLSSAVAGSVDASVILTEVGALAPEAHLALAARLVPQYVLSVTKRGGGSGRVTSNPAGIDCGDDCSGLFSEGTPIRLTAVAEPGHSFLGWDGVCFGAEPICWLHAFSNEIVQAFFEPQPPDVELVNQVASRGSISGPIPGGTWRYYFADLGTGNGELVVDLFDMSGNANLHIHYNQKPDGSSFRCPDVNGGTARRCVITPPSVGRWWVGVSNSVSVVPVEFTIRASWGPLGVDQALANGVPIADFVSSDESGGSWRYYSADVYEDDLLVQLRDLSADADLFVRLGAKPDRSNFDCFSANASTLPESCHLPDATPGRWWVGVNNFSPGTVTYTLEATWGTSAAADFYSVGPCRLLDTRTVGLPLGDGVPRSIVIAGTCGVPATAKAVSLNVTVVGPSGAGQLTLYPDPGVPPATSTVHFAAGQSRANNTLLRLGAGGTLEAAALLAAGGQVHLILDVNGYFE